MPKSASQAATPKQRYLDLGIEMERDVRGIEMGVLENGIAYLTQRGLAQLSGAARSTIQKVSEEWEVAQSSDVIQPETRIGWLRTRLAEDEYHDQKLFIEAGRAGKRRHAYPDVVCMALIEHFAFEAKVKSATALKNYRLIARHGLRKFIYDALGYNSAGQWRHYNDRVSLLKDAAPDGYFIIFREIAGMVVDLITEGVAVNDKTIPDISVGNLWGKFWDDGGFDEVLGRRVRWLHNYPEYYPQAESNPQLAWAYPNEALPAFREWFSTIYLPHKFPNYILRKAKVLKGGVEEARRIGGMYAPKQVAAATAGSTAGVSSG